MRPVQFAKISILLTLGAQTLAQETDLASTNFQIQWQAQHSGVTASLRGLSAVNSAVAWASGTGGQFLKTTDGGENWLVKVVPGADSLDFRDVEAFDANHAFLMSAGPGEKSRIYKTSDGGRTWQLQFTNPHPDGFLDGITFWDADNGIAYGDPVDGHPFIIITRDGGATWVQMPPESIPTVVEGEYGFAASGTGIRTFGTDHVWICSGGSAARVFHSINRGLTWQVVSTPILCGKQSAGIFSLAFRDEKIGIAVGGDYAAPAESGANVARTTDGGRTWQLVDGATGVSYRSCVSFVPDASPPLLVAVGTPGTSYSADDGLTWTQVDTVGNHVVNFGDSPDAGWAAGADGRIAKLILTRVAGEK